MGNSPFRSTLYRRGWRLVICAGLTLVVAAAAWAQFARKNAVSKGPRAIALLALPGKGKARLIPVAIMVDGHFYDAGAYKADPVPMALEAGTVYEAERTGESVGLFTISLDLQQKNNWIAEGTYHVNGEQVASNGHKAETKPREDKDEGPPVLHRPGSQPSKPATPAAESKPPAPTPDSKPTTPDANKENTTATATPPPKPEPAPDDPNIPKLRRGPQEKSTAHEEPTPVSTKAAGAAKPSTATTTAGKTTEAPKPADVQTIPAISDADGPEPHAYTYAMSPGEEEGFRIKMLAMAADELRKQAKAFAPKAAPASPGGPAATQRRRLSAKKVPKPPQPTFDDIQLRVFDVSASNEPVLVLTLTAHPAQTGKEEAKVADYYVTLVTRSDIYGELRKLFSEVTDSEELDVNPRMQLIDAVDADGDGRGELLFKQISDAGSAFAIYRVLPDRLWSLYEGTPQ
jgi:hypothetical protein